MHGIWKHLSTLSISLRVHLVQDETIPSSKAPKSHVKLITYMNNDNGFDILITVFFDMITQLGGLGLKAHDLVLYFRLGEGKKIHQFRIRALQIRSEIFLLQD